MCGNHPCTPEQLRRSTCIDPTSTKHYLHLETLALDNRLTTVCTIKGFWIRIDLTLRKTSTKFSTFICSIRDKKSQKTPVRPTPLLDELTKSAESNCYQEVVDLLAVDSDNSIASALLPPL